MPPSSSAYIQAMGRHYNFTADVDGRTCSGIWSLKQGAKVCVSSAWGAEIVDCGSLRPEECAKRTLVRIVKADQKKRAADQKRREREIARVHRYWDRQKMTDTHGELK